MKEKTRVILLVLFGSIVAGSIAALMFYSAFTHQSAVDVVTGAGTRPEEFEGEDWFGGGAVGTLLFGDSITLEVGDTVTYEDELTVALTAIDDSRCPAGSQCVWEGEITGTLTLNGSSTVKLGQLSAPQAEADPYMIVLQAATQDTVTVIVTRK